MPSTRARTSATRNADVRPGNSVVSSTRCGSISTTPTSIGGGFALGCDPSLLQAPASATDPASHAAGFMITTCGCSMCAAPRVVCSAATERPGAAGDGSSAALTFLTMKGSGGNRGRQSRAGFRQCGRNRYQSGFAPDSLNK
jgi:hypothetical protein